MVAKYLCFIPLKVYSLESSLRDTQHLEATTQEI